MIDPNNYGKVKIHDRDGDISKRWYVSYSFRNPVTGKMERFRIYGHVNRFKTRKERIERLRSLKRATEKLLQEGFNPYQTADNSNQSIDTVPSAINYVLEIKKQQLAESSYDSFRSHVLKFQKWTEATFQDHLPPNRFSKQDVNTFLEWSQRKYGLNAQTRNNYLSDTRSFFTALLDKDIISHNPASGISKLKVDPVKNRAFTNAQLDSIQEFLNREDPYFLSFLRFMSYEFMRPIEVLRIRVGNIDLQEGILYLDTKTKRDKKKIIVSPLLAWLKNLNLEKYDSSDYLFTRFERPGGWEAKEATKRRWFSAKFAHVKSSLKLGEEYGVYSFRHTYITNLYHSLRKSSSSSYEAKMKLMPITGHSTLDALNSYLRDIQAELPEDYSDQIVQI
ncbi:tyrosine-type recombinase/integrase [Phaeocystidibacter marisrubri]|uniref:Site-specific integrase n=1 Tax=Phaeocystidibacter marisrubri TaxID=1577780 RepID=A0A6L3ZG83_9FLAO|nr:tyrosine-type recombinase/integrase [Phaeocystidibacter marisrubri]KAB2816827.1 site-specific integrase [Phaeocystidibacter marisrubri]GGH77981.1 hypothetical protein GCM10011318_28570 [Phaeocystidibacter marisrubri]